MAIPTSSPSRSTNSHAVLAIALVCRRGSPEPRRRASRLLGWTSGSTDAGLPLNFHSDHRRETAAVGVNGQRRRPPPRPALRLPRACWSRRQQSPKRGKGARGPRALHGRLDAPRASQVPGCCKHQSSSRAASGRVAAPGQTRSRPPVPPATGTAPVAETRAASAGCRTAATHRQRHCVRQAPIRSDRSAGALPRGRLTPTPDTAPARLLCSATKLACAQVARQIPVARVLPRCEDPTVLRGRCPSSSSVTFINAWIGCSRAVATAASSSIDDLFCTVAAVGRRIGGTGIRGSPHHQSSVRSMDPVRDGRSLELRTHLRCAGGSIGAHRTQEESRP